MVKLPNIIPITDLRQGAAGVIRRVKDSREPIFITQRGRATAVVMSAEVYERSENEREILKLLARGEKEIEAGTGNELSVVMAKAEALLQDKRS
jgi:prevent-host-death family protein